MKKRKKMVLLRKITAVVPAIAMMFAMVVPAGALENISGGGHF